MSISVLNYSESSKKPSKSNIGIKKSGTIFTKDFRATDGTKKYNKVFTSVFLEHIQRKHNLGAIQCSVYDQSKGYTYIKLESGETIKSEEYNHHFLDENVKVLILANPEILG